MPPLGQGFQQKKKKRAGNPPPLTKEDIERIADLINKGERSLPELDLPDDDAYDSIWAPVDSGSSVDVVDAPTTFPGATVDAPAPGATGFKCANNEVVADKGSATVPFKTAEGLKHMCKWRNAKLAMPIISTGQLARNGKHLLNNEDDGYMLHANSQHTSRFVGAHGVYVLQMRVPKRYTRLHPDDPHPQQGVGRQGTLLAMLSVRPPLLPTGNGGGVSIHRAGPM